MKKRSIILVIVAIFTILILILMINIMKRDKPVNLDDVLNILENQEYNNITIHSSKNETNLSVSNQELNGAIKLITECLNKKDQWKETKKLSGGYSYFISFDIDSNQQIIFYVTPTSIRLNYQKNKIILEDTSLYSYLETINNQ